MLCALPPLNGIIQVNLLDGTKRSSSFAYSERKQKISSTCFNYSKCTGITLLLVELFYLLPVFLFLQSNLTHLL